MEAAMKSPLRVLHLEDNPNDAELIQAALQSEGIVSHVVRVETRADFLASLEQGGFDIILADYTLPSFDGLSALSIAMEKCPDVPFIFVSGTLGEEVAIEALKIGATDYLLKERLSSIGPSVHRALREARERDERRRAEALLAGEKRLLEMIAKGNPLSMILDALCRLVEELSKGSLSSILLLDPDGTRFWQRTGHCLRYRPGSPVGRLSRSGLTTRAPSVLVDAGTRLGWPGTGNLRDILPRTEQSYATAAKYHRTDHRSCEHRDRAQAGRGGAPGPSLVP